MGHSAHIREGMEVIGADGVHIGTVHDIHHHRIGLKRADASAGIEGQLHEGHRHYLPIGLVAEIEGRRVRLTATAANALQFVEEEAD